jgi:hypothetical protein
MRLSSAKELTMNHHSNGSRTSSTAARIATFGRLALLLGALALPLSGCAFGCRDEQCGWLTQAYGTTPGTFGL